MKKINNKGITLVELIVTFALLMIIVIGMLNIVNDIRTDAINKQEFSKLEDFKNDMVVKIQKELLSLSPNINNSKCSVTSNSIICGTFSFTINIINKEIILDGITYKLPYSNKYDFLNNHESFSNISISIDNDYLVIDVPYFKMNDIINSSITSDNVDDYNYGFKIIYPTNL